MSIIKDNIDPDLNDILDKAKELISKLKEPYKGTIIGKKRANRVYNNYVWSIEKYKNEYKFDCKSYIKKCMDKINA